MNRSDLQPLWKRYRTMQATVVGRGRSKLMEAYMVWLVSGELEPRVTVPVRSWSLRGDRALRAWQESVDESL